MVPLRSCFILWGGHDYSPPLSSFPRGDILCRNVNFHALHCAYSGLLYTSPRFIPSFEYPSMITFAVMKINETLLPYPPRRVIPSSKYCNKGKHRLIYRRSRHYFHYHAGNRTPFYVLQQIILQTFSYFACTIRSVVQRKQSKPPLKTAPVITPS